MSGCDRADGSPAWRTVVPYLWLADEDATGPDEIETLTNSNNDGPRLAMLAKRRVGRACRAWRERRGDA